MVIGPRLSVALGEIRSAIFKIEKEFDIEIKEFRFKDTEYNKRLVKE